VLSCHKISVCSFIVFALLSSPNATAADIRGIANSISYKDLNEPCPGKFLEIHTLAKTSDEAGMAIMKIFWLVDKKYLKRIANSEINPEEWGLMVGEMFRYYCEKSSPAVTVRAAAISTIRALE